MSSKGWYAFDLDGTLAHYDGWKGVEHIGEPIPVMVEAVKRLLAAGEEVRIFTARVTVNDERSMAEAQLARTAIMEWCRTHIGQPLFVTNVKDFGMIQLFDDRAVQIEMNTGRPILDNGIPCPACGEESVCCATLGDQRWLECFKCKQRYQPVPQEAPDGQDMTYRS